MCRCVRSIAVDWSEVSSPDGLRGEIARLVGHLLEPRQRPVLTVTSIVVDDVVSAVSGSFMPIDHLAEVVETLPRSLLRRNHRPPA